jgi:hypothetical protein
MRSSTVPGVGPQWWRGTALGEPKVGVEWLQSSERIQLNQTQKQLDFEEVFTYMPHGHIDDVENRAVEYPGNTGVDDNV